MCRPEKPTVKLDVGAEVLTGVLCEPGSREAKAYPNQAVLGEAKSTHDIIVNQVRTARLSLSCSKASVGLQCAIGPRRRFS